MSSRRTVARALPVLLALACGLVCAFDSGAAHGGASRARQSDEPPAIADDALPALAQALAAGDAEALAALRRAGPSIVPRLRPLLGADDAPALRRLVEGIARDALRRSALEEGSVRYRGQFAALRDLGPTGADLLLEVFADEDARIDERTRAATALGDTGGPEQVPALREIAEDDLAEPWVEREAIFLLARFGDRERIDRRLEALTEIAEQPLTAATIPAILAAHGELAEVHYRIDEFDTAVTHYLKKQALLEEMLVRVRAELRAPLQAEIELLQYNLACSLSLAGRIDDAYAALDRSMASREITLDMVRSDGDLRAVRADPRYAEKLAEWSAKREAMPPEPGVAPGGGGEDARPAGTPPPGPAPPRDPERPPAPRPGEA